MKSRTLVPVERVEKVILLIRGEKVILDADLAALYGVSTKRLNEQVKRNKGRFPDDFTFPLTNNEDTFPQLFTPRAFDNSAQGNTLGYQRPYFPATLKGVE